MFNLKGERTLKESFFTVDKEERISETSSISIAWIANLRQLTHDKIKLGVPCPCSPFCHLDKTKVTLPSFLAAQQIKRHFDLENSKKEWKQLKTSIYFVVWLLTSKLEGNFIFCIVNFLPSEKNSCWKKVCEDCARKVGHKKILPERDFRQERSFYLIFWLLTLFPALFGCFWEHQLQCGGRAPLLFVTFWPLSWLVLSSSLYSSPIWDLPKDPKVIDFNPFQW